MADLSKAGSEGSGEIARRIRSARARAGITRRQLAATSGASERYLATLEAGAGNPSVDMLMAIANALDIAMVDLLPMGGERDLLVHEATARLRRLPPDRLREVFGLLGQAAEGRGEKARRIVLIGLRGAGKTSLGQALADRLSFPFYEISKEVEQLYGGGIAVLMDISGPSVLRRYEAEVFDRVIAEQPAAVIAAPGAIVADSALYEKLLQSSWTIWLEASPEHHMQRVIAQGDLRPMAGNRAAMDDLKSILAAREADYARADARINTSSQDFDATVDMLEAAVRALI